MRHLGQRRRAMSLSRLLVAYGDWRPLSWPIGLNCFSYFGWTRGIDGALSRHGLLIFGVFGRLLGGLDRLDGR